MRGAALINLRRMLYVVAVTLLTLGGVGVATNGTLGMVR